MVHESQKIMKLIMQTMEQLSARKLSFLAFFLLSFSIIGQRMPKAMPEDLEIAIAKSALPANLRDNATVYVLKNGTGYVKAVEGSNGYTCYVERPALEGTMAPIAFDAEGTRVMLPPRFEKAKMIQEGKTYNEAQAVIDKGFQNGTYMPPAIGGISYMLSPLNILPRGNSGKKFLYHPHFMIYAPYATNKSIQSRFTMDGYLPFVNPTGPHGFIVVPVGKAERVEIKEEHQALIAKYEAYEASRK